MAKADFVNGLLALGFEPQEPRPDFIIFDYKIPCGKLIGKEVKIGFQVNDSFPGVAPHGPHFNEELLPASSGGIHNNHSVNGWQHWSRPFNEWNRTDRTVKTYMAHIKNVLNTI